DEAEEQCPPFLAAARIVGRGADLRRDVHLSHQPYSAAIAVCACVSLAIVWWTAAMCRHWISCSPTCATAFAPDAITSCCWTRAKLSSRKVSRLKDRP